MTSAGALAKLGGSSVAAAVSIVAVVAVCTGAIALSDQQASGQDESNAAVLIPADGHVEWFVDQDGVVRSTESSRATGVEEFLTLPSMAAHALLGGLSDSEVRNATLWRETTTTVTDGETTQNGELFRFTDAGVESMVVWGGEVSFLYTPGLLVLPTDVAPGSSWQGEGTAFVNESLNYRSRFTAHEPENASLLKNARVNDPRGCIETRGVIEYLDDAGALLLTINEADLWCPGRGRVAIDATVEDTVVIQAGIDAPRLQSQSATRSIGAWTDPSAWRDRELQTVRRDPVYGEDEGIPSYSVVPALTASGIIVSTRDSGDDLVALRYDASDRSLVHHWIGHPGGHAIALGAVGDIIIVTTSSRRIVAYSDAGERLWTRDTNDLVVAAPVSDGAGNAIIVGLDGVVTSVDAISGKTRWETPIGADVDQRAVAGVDTVIVVDRAGRVVALDRSDGDIRWDANGTEAYGIAIADDVVVVAQGDSWVTSYRLTTGTKLWDARYLGLPSAVQAAAGQVVVVSDEESVAFDPDDGTILWSRDGASHAIGDGKHVILVDRDSATLVDDQGETVLEWKIQVETDALSRHVLAGRDGIWSVQSLNSALRIGEP
ncbi:PQQ-binding-like beta-propeller repeat protein [Cryobacterium sp. BB307]|uniref:outer membrane protein assembly factor BamB family protein n=1 Tax=Cryobacterium sp. BB307 TaxID=2716317 RepID=UPI001446D054|nr:PQQ-binding-like beta-propeller repeat protein [Cryobacterium sp. BB307]